MPQLNLKKLKDPKKLGQLELRVDSGGFPFEEE